MATNERTCKIIVSDSFYPLLDNKARYLVLCGGRGSGKSEFAARKIVYRCLKEGHHRFLVLRKVRRRVEESCLEVFLRVLSGMEIPFTLNKSTFTVSFYGNEVLFDGLDDPQKIKSIKGLTGIWLEETTEFSEADFTTIDLCLREAGPEYLQILMTFNPDEAVAAWLKERFFWTDIVKTGEGKAADSFIHHSTIEDNPDPEMRSHYLRVLEELKGQNEALYKVNRLGVWAASKGRIFFWDDSEVPPVYDEVFYGGDFGFSVDPATVVRIYRRADHFWVQEVIYQRGLINSALGGLMRQKGIKPSDPVYFDSADPKSIQELCEMGFNILPADKGPDSVRAGIMFLLSKTIHIVHDSPNIIREANGYSWKEDKNGHMLPEPVKFEDHTMDAIRYGICTHMKRVGRAVIGISEEAVY